ncbi:hypothetical protein DFS33DRAFT_975602 [Desarmillaria ectypa]|nr:hypothetical protein DFS33DRAFT_975602 [Desarmillaria ectypa]
MHKQLLPSIYVLSWRLSSLCRFLPAIPLATAPTPTVPMSKTGSVVVKEVSIVICCKRGQCADLTSTAAIGTHHNFISCVSCRDAVGLKRRKFKYCIRRRGRMSQVGSRGAWNLARIEPAFNISLAKGCS